MKHIPKWLQLTIKIVVTVLCLWYVSHKINWVETWILLKNSNWFWLVAATILFTASKIVSSVRLNIYFKNINVQLTETANLKLYWLGMFYNLFLPGGISGDAYKVILLNRQQNYPLKPLSAVVLLDRLSGMAGLGILAGVYFYFVGTKPYNIVTAVAIIPGIIIFYFFVKKIFPSFIKSFGSTLLLGITVQALQVASIYCIMASVPVTHDNNIYVFIFLLSSIINVLPVTFGPYGLREAFFSWAGLYFFKSTNGLSESVYISVLFSTITLFVSLVGVIWVFKKIDLQQTSA